MRSTNESCIIPSGFSQEHFNRCTSKKTNCSLHLLEGADLENKDLTGVSLLGSCLVSANLKNTKLSTHALYGADIRHAKITESENNELDTKNTPGRIISIKDKSNTLVNVIETYKFSTLSIMAYKTKASNPIYAFIIGLLYETFGNENQKKEAETYYLKAAEQKYSPALNNLGWMYEHGFYVEKSTEKAKKYYQDAAKDNLVGQFNLLRIEANTTRDAYACYHIANKYRTGADGTVPVDFFLCFYWMKESAKKNHSKACRYVGAMYRSGTGTKKNLKKSFTYLQLGADPNQNETGENGDPEAQYELGINYEFGYGCDVNYEKARYWFKISSDRADNREALIHLGKLYEEGKGGEISYKAAKLCYEKASKQDSITGLYNFARMLEHFPSEENGKRAVNIYLQILEKDPFHIGALFLLGYHYQKGYGIEKNLEKAESFYKKSEQNGHLLAKTRITVMKIRGTACDLNSNAFEADIDVRICKAKEFVDIQLNKQFSCGSYYFTNDFKCCLPILQSYAEKITPGQAIMNSLCLPYDPFICDVSFLEEIDENQLEEEYFDDLFDKISAAGNKNPALTSEMLSELYRVKYSINHSREHQRRFLRLYNAWTSDSKGFYVPDEFLENSLEYRMGKVAEKLVQNIGRCADGISTFFADEEIGFALDNTSNDIPIGLRICLALIRYKQTFLQQHIPPENNDNYERNTETLALLYQRMRLILGLPGTFTTLRYSSMASNIPPDGLVRRFLLGGDYNGQGIINRKFSPYSVSNVCKYLQQIIDDRDDTLLTVAHISEFLQLDPVLEEKASDAFVDFEENDYCNPFVDANSSPYKPKVLERILFLHGYVSNHTP